MHPGAADGLLHAWGNNEYGQTGIPNEVRSDTASIWMEATDRPNRTQYLGACVSQNDRLSTVRQTLTDVKDVAAGGTFSITLGGTVPTTRCRICTWRPRT